MKIYRRFSILLAGMLLLVLGLSYFSRGEIIRSIEARESETIRDIEGMIDQALQREMDFLTELAAVASVGESAKSQKSIGLSAKGSIDFIAVSKADRLFEIKSTTLSPLSSTRLIEFLKELTSGARYGFVYIDRELVAFRQFVIVPKEGGVLPETWVIGQIWGPSILERFSLAVRANVALVEPADYESMIRPSNGNATVVRPLTSWDGSTVAFLEFSTPVGNLGPIRSLFLNYFWVSTAGICFIILLIGYFILRWVTQPLHVIGQSLSQEVIGDMHLLQNQSSEFGVISKRLSKFFVQRSALLKELEWHQKTEKALNQSERDYRELFERAHDAILIIDIANESITAANAEAHMIYGIDHDKIPGMALSEVWPDESLRRRFISHTEEHGAIPTWEISLTRSDGKELVLEISSTKVEYQRQPSIMCIGRDISDRKHYEELRLSQTILRQVNNLIIVGNSSGRIIYVNHAVAALTGYRKVELLGYGWWKLTHDEVDSQTEMQYIIEAAGGRRTIASEPYDRELKCKDGSRVWIRWYDTKGPEDLLIGVGIDITIQKHVVEALKASEEHYRLLFNNNPSAIILYDAKSMEIIEANPAACRLYGYDRMTFQKLMLPAIAPDDYQLRQTHATVEGMIPGRHRRADGRMLDVEVIDHAVDYRNRNARLALIRELSERKRAELAEMELRTQKIRVATIVRTQEEERRRIARELHDGLGQVLTALKRDLEYSELRKQSESKDSALRLLDNAISETRRLAHNLMPSALEDLGLFAALDRLCYQCFSQTEVRINFQTFNFDERLPAASELNVYRIVQEAFNNILKHANATEVTLQIVGHDDRLIMTIEDNGSGFDLAATRGANRGLGLLSMRERVEFLGGEIEINSTPNQGTSLIIEIPLSMQVEHA